jgi:hypothetical protein
MAGRYFADLQFDSRDTVAFAAARTIGPDSLGQIRKFENVGIALIHNLNQSSTLSFSTDYSHQNSIQAVTDLYSAAITYGYHFSRDWNLTLSYRFRQRTGDGGPANSNSVFFSLRRDFTILPGATGEVKQPVVEPTALMASPAEWAVTRRFAPSDSTASPY